MVRMEEMKNAASLRAKQRPGRPRSARAEQAILDATLALLAEVGIEALSIEGVAARAGVGKTTIYRRWASKEELIVAAVRRIQVQAPIVDTGNLREDLLAIAHAGEQGDPRAALQRVLPRFLGEAASNPALYQTYLDFTFAPRWQQLIAMIERARERGEVRADLHAPSALNLVLGGLLIGWLITDRMEPLPPDFVDRVIDTLWRGIAAPP